MGNVMRQVLKAAAFTGWCVMASAYGADELSSQEELFEGPEYANAFNNPKDHPERPNVLLIGDSISNAYTVDVRKLLHGKADVFRIPSNGKNTAFGLKNLNKWLAMKPGKWDVIHFNWGLWDLCYRNPESKTQGHRDKVIGTIMATPEQYRDNMEKIVARLMKTDATLIWCTTTPVPEHEAGRKLGDDLVYNAIAEKIMKANGIRINDLHAHALLKYDEIQRQKGDVHYSPEGSAYLAGKVAQEISTVLDPAGIMKVKPASGSRPNIILMMADDLGRGDVHCFNPKTKIRTPELDVMAKTGMQFNRFYSSSPVCSPRRGSGITGRHPFRYGIYYANEGHMKDGELTLAELSKAFEMWRRSCAQSDQGLDY